MIELENGYKFETSGRTFYANGYIGIYERDDKSIGIAEGYDGFIKIRSLNDESDEPEMTQQEKHELADYMISLWTKFKTK